MAQSLITFPPETVFAECRAFVFFFDIQLNRWSEVAEPNIYSRIQLLCSRPPGSTGIYRLVGRLETTGMVTINIQLSDSVAYLVTNATWHQIRVQGGLYYGLRVSPESDGMKFSVIIQNTVRSLQGTRIPPQKHVGNWGAPPEAPPMGQAPASPVAAPKTSDPPPQDALRTQKRREYDAQIDALCITLSDAIRNGSEESAVELVKQVTTRKLALSIKLKNPVFVTMDAGCDSINIRVVVEDKESSGGAFSMKVSPKATIERLQQEVFDRYGFPVQVQKWIIGKKIPRPQDTLQDLNVRQSGHTVFLYLLSGKKVGLRKSDAEQLGRGNSTSLPVSITSSAAATTAAASSQMRRATSTPSLPGQGEHSTLSASRTVPLPTVHHSPHTSFQNQENSGPTTMPAAIPPGMTIGQLRDFLHQRYGGSQGDVSNPADPPQEEAFVNNLETAQQPTEEDGRALGWTCPVCTYINLPTRPGCEMCSSDRPADYVVPDGTRLDERERTRIAAEERSEALFHQGEERLLSDGALQRFLQAENDD